MLTVKNILDQKGPYFNMIDPDKTVLEAIAFMKAENISYLIVRKEDEYAGIICERDYAHKVILRGKHSDTTLVKDIMSVDMPVVSLTDTAEYCMKLMNVAKSRYLPVFDEIEFRGIITIHDLMRAAINELEQHVTKFAEHHESLVHDY